MVNANEVGDPHTKHELLVKASLLKCRDSFQSYYVMFNHSTGFFFGRLQRYVARWIDGIVRDRDAKCLKGGRGALSQPPQTGKSTLTTKEYVSFLLGAIPGVQIAIVGHSGNLLYRFSNWIRDRVQTPLWGQIFEHRIKPGQDKVSEWAMTNGSRLIVSTVNQPLTGSHVDVLIIDDVYSGREEAERPQHREKIKNWYMANCLTRISPKGSIICVNTRWHKEDLIGYLTSEDYEETVRDTGGDERDLFSVINLPALCEEPQSDLLKREEGGSIFPEYKSSEWFQRIKAQMDPYEWKTQYQGDPQIRTESDLDLNKIQEISLDQVPEGLEIIRAWDTALSEDQLSDYTAGALMCYDPTTDSIYVLDMFKNRLTWTRNFKIIVEKTRVDAERFGVSRISVEAVAGFGAVFQQLKSALLGEVKVIPRYPPKGGKLLRAQPWINKIDAGRFYVVKGAWVKDFKAELMVFPAGAHDDQIDAISNGWETLVGRNRNGADPNAKTSPSGRPVVTKRPVGVDRRPLR